MFFLGHGVDNLLLPNGRLSYRQLGFLFLVSVCTDTILLRIFDLFIYFYLLSPVVKVAFVNEP